MLKSMTAYSRVLSVIPLGRFVLELQSVNRKFLEVNTVLPRSLACFDSEIKKWIANKVHRGQVNVRLSVAFNQAASGAVRPNLALAAQLKSSWDQIADHLGVERSSFSLDLLVREEGLLLYDEELQDADAIKEALEELVSKALDQLMEMKGREGLSLKDDIEQRLEKLKNSIDLIAQKAPNAICKYKTKLLQKVQETMSAVSISDGDERILKEVCLFADKVDIAEEITRFHSHLAQFKQILAQSSESVGKTIEFLVQELNREANTIGSKSADLDISGHVIKIKTELERIREQIQNVE